MNISTHCELLFIRDFIVYQGVILHENILAFLDQLKGKSFMETFLIFIVFHQLYYPLRGYFSILFQSRACIFGLHFYFFPTFVWFLFDWSSIFFIMEHFHSTDLNMFFMALFDVHKFLVSIRIFISRQLKCSFISTVRVLVVPKQLIKESQSQVPLFIIRIQFNTFFSIIETKSISLTLCLSKGPIGIIDRKCILGESGLGLSFCNGCCIGFNCCRKMKFFKHFVSILFQFFTFGDNRTVHSPILSNYKQKYNFNQLYLMIDDRYTAPISQHVEQEKSKSCFAHIGQVLKRFNPCLRPERQSQNLTKFLQEFKQVSLYEDPYFGEVFLLESITGNHQLLLKKEKMHLSEAPEREQQIRQLESYKNNPHLISQFLVQKINKAGFLWTKVELYLAYDFIVFDLRKQFQYRLTKGTAFTDRQITSIIRGACKGFIPLQSTDYSSVRMSYIYFTRKGIAKVAHPNLFHYKSNLQQICQYDESKGIYLSPEEMYCLEKGQKNAILGWKSNYYVFGMVLLSLMSQNHLNEVYDYSACYIDRVKVDQLLRNCKETYPEKLVNLVEKLIQERPEDRLTFRNLLNQLSYNTEVNHEVSLELLNQKTKPVQLPVNLASTFMQPIQRQEPQYTNYLAGLVYPKIGRAGQFYNEAKLGASNYRQSRISNNDQGIIAEQRHFYHNKNSSYIGDGKVPVSLSSMQAKPYRQGKGYYQNHDGQLYLGDWVKGEMEGHGKLYWDQKRIRYEGDFKGGKFHGRGIQYNGDPRIVGHIEEEDEPDHTFIRMQRDNWQKYEGNFVEDRRQGQGIAYFKSGRWMGNFKNGQPNGHGIFMDNNGQETRGVWKDGILQ